MLDYFLMQVVRLIDIFDYCITDLYHFLQVLFISLTAQNLQCATPPPRSLIMTKINLKDCFCIEYDGCKAEWDSQQGRKVIQKWMRKTILQLHSKYKMMEISK